MARKLKVEDVSAALRSAGPSSSDFDLSPHPYEPEEKVLRAAGVLVPIRVTKRGLRLVLTKRASGLKHHPGQISFPGGRAEETDMDIVHTALREADEEIGLKPHAVDVVGDLPTHVTVTNFRMYPVVGFVGEDFVPKADPGEVSEVFEVPIEHVVEQKNFVVQSRRWRGERRFFYTVPFGPYYIWGATARILRGLAERM